MPEKHFANGKAYFSKSLNFKDRFGFVGLTGRGGEAAADGGDEFRCGSYRWWWEVCEIVVVEKP